MATAYVSFGRVGGTAPNGLVSQIRNGNPDSTEVVTTSASATASAGAASTDGFASVFCDTAVYAHAAESTDVTPVNGWYCPAGVETAIGVTKGQKISLIDV